ncbi:HAD family hydrolase [Patulibacter sp.]|uniref:HAD family hydrolase n=1 Tax=Patulibacter sp. TaxID=1912859 RepID=UPI002721B93E|nr:haloacid dehalogenase-like hydrolase [Patulibacter sp.]MDO9406896.1 haloacid dehalogenase-like hydrolase [Patulibacter sp.]
MSAPDPASAAAGDDAPATARPPAPEPVPAGAAVPWLLLWDIDGTLLLRASASHARAVWDALCEVHGLEDRELLRNQQMAGMTDGQIAREILTAAGVDGATVDHHAETVLERVCSSYVPGDLETHVSPGLEDALRELSDRGDVVHSLVTGNYERIARRKLQAAGIGGWFDPRVGGGFGSDHEDRLLLPATARRRAGEALLPDDRPWPADRAVVIGDTPRDVACARHDGVHVVAVATGSHDPAELQDADVVVHSAAEIPAAVAGLITRSPEVPA